MKNMDKTMVMFYRGKDYSSIICLNTAKLIYGDKFTKKICHDKYGKKIPFEVFNIDKKSYEKYFSELDKLPDVLYVWDDEEIVIDNILKNYPSIELRIYGYDSNKCRFINNYINVLAQSILNEYKEPQGTVDLWLKNNYSYKKVTLYSCDYEILDEKEKEKYFLTKSQVKESILKDIEIGIKNCEEMIEHYNNKILEFKELKIEIELDK